MGAAGGWCTIAVVASCRRQRIAWYKSQTVELARRLAKAVLEHTAHELHDDTTLVLVQRRDGHPT